MWYNQEKSLTDKHKLWKLKPRKPSPNKMSQVPEQPLSAQDTHALGACTGLDWFLLWYCKWGLVGFPCLSPWFLQMVRASFSVVLFVCLFVSDLDVFGISSPNLNLSRMEQVTSLSGFWPWGDTSVSPTEWDVPAGVCTWSVLGWHVTLHPHVTVSLYHKCVWMLSNSSSTAEDLILWFCLFPVEMVNHVADLCGFILPVSLE